MPKYDLSNPSWAPQHPVRTILLERRAAGSLPGDRADPYKVGLAIEGGGLRGVVSAGMLCALEDLGYHNCWDGIYACSSGAINAAYFLLRETWFPLSIYYDDLTTGEFLDFKRIARGKAPMDLDYVFRDVLTHRKPLSYETVINDPAKIHVTITDVESTEQIVAKDFGSGAELEAALRASAWLPLATKGTAEFRGRASIDGGVSRFHPFRAALADGCTHILSLSTKPIGPRRRTPSLMDHFAAANLDRMRSGLGRTFIRSRTEYLQEDLPRLLQERSRTSQSATNVLDVAPIEQTPEVKRDETDRALLFDGAKAGFRSVYLCLEQRDVALAPKITVYEPKNELRLA